MIRTINFDYCENAFLTLYTKQMYNLKIKNKHKILKLHIIHQTIT